MVAAARPRSGPAPDPDALRRDRKSDSAWTTLPSGGFTGPVPDWPLADGSDREAELWSAFWRKPQAVLWARNQQAFEVAMHVRCFAEAERLGAPTSIRTLVRQQADALLLTIPAMHSARVRMASDELAPVRAAPRPAGPSQPSVRDRLRAVSGEG